jgi:flagellar motor switch protein FliN
MAESPINPPDERESLAAGAPEAVGDDSAREVVDGQPSAEAVAEQSLDAAERAASDISDAVGSRDARAAHPLDLPEFNGSIGGAAASGAESGLGLLDDIELDVTIELGRTRMYVEDVLRLNTDSVVELDKAAGDPVDIFVNDRHVARGEVLVLNENFCVRISEIVKQPAEPE